MAALCSAASPTISRAAALGLSARGSASFLRLRLRAASRSCYAAPRVAAAAGRAPSWRVQRRFAASADSTTDEDTYIDTMIPPDNRIPATIITGFLGSSKISVERMRFNRLACQLISWWSYQMAFFPKETLCPHSRHSLTKQ